MSRKKNTFYAKIGCVIISSLIVINNISWAYSVGNLQIHNLAPQSLFQQGIATALSESAMRGESRLLGRELLSLSDAEIMSLMPSGHRELRKHSVAVYKYARKIAREMGFENDSLFMQKLRVICLAHDVGGLLGVEHDEEIERKLISLGEKYVPDYKGMNPEDILKVFEAKGVTLSSEEKRYIPVMDHSANSIRVLENAGILVPSDVKDIISKHVDILTDKDMEAWPEEKRQLLACLLLSEILDFGNSYYNRKVKSNKGFEDINETLDFIRTRRDKDARLTARAVRAVENLVRDGILEEEILYSRSRTLVENNPITEAIGERYSFRVDIEMELITTMVWKALKRGKERYRSRLYINAMLDEQYSKDNRYVKLLEMVSNPIVLSDGSIEVFLRTTLPGKRKKYFSVIYTGSSLSDWRYKKNIQIFKENLTTRGVLDCSISGTDSFSTTKINKVADILAKQVTNVVFEKNARLGRWCFRRSSIYIPVDQQLCDLLGQILENEGKTSFLLKLRENERNDIVRALLNIVTGGGQIAKSFEERGISCRYEFKKVLFVAPYGDQNGDPLKFIVPHLGVEKLAYISNYDLNDVDARVYNPNLGSKDGLIEFIKQEGGFDVIGFSVLQVVLRATLELLCKAKAVDPDALIMVGGSELDKLPDDFFRAVPFDIAVKGDGSSMIDVLREMRVNDSRDETFKRLQEVRGLVLSTIKEGEVELKLTGRQKNIIGRDEYASFTKNIPYEEPDLTHGKKYASSAGDKEAALMPIFCDDIGKKTLRVTTSDFCRGKCIYCNAERNVHPAPSVEKVMDYIRTNYKGHDSIQISSVDFLHDVEYVKALCRTLISSEFKDVPKLFVSRVNKITPELAKLLREAGFVAGAQGIESFDSGILKHLRKGATREMNIRAIDTELQAGIKPGIYIMFFTPWSTAKTSFDTLDLCLDYVNKGAYLNMIPDIDVHYGSPLAERREVIQTVKIEFPGMHFPLEYPTTGKILDRDLKVLRERTYEIFDDVSSSSDIPEPHQNSLTVYSLLFFKAFSLAYKEKNPEDHVNNGRIERIDETINFVINNEMETLEGKVMDFDPAYYSDQGKIPTEESSSLNLEEYVNDKLPEELRKDQGKGFVNIEIHRGPQRFTDKYLKNMEWRGYSIRMVDEGRDSSLKIYKLEKNGKKTYVFSNIHGFTRELTIVQMLLHMKWLSENIKIRKYDFKIREALRSMPLSSYAGKISKAVISHDIKEFGEIIAGIEDGMKVIERFHNDIASYFLLERKNGELILLYDINYAYGKSISEVSEYLVSGIEDGGLGVKEIVLRSACGAIGGNIALNDVLLCSEVHYRDEHTKMERNHQVDEQLFRELLPENIGIHKVPVFTIDGILNGNIEMTSQVERRGGGAIELEMWHLNEMLKKYPDAKLKAFFEVHDKPGIGSDKTKALGKDVPGFEGKDKMRKTWEAIGRYILKEDHPETLSMDSSDAYQNIEAAINTAQHEGKISDEEAKEAVFLVHDVDYGDVAGTTVRTLVAENNWEDLIKFVRLVASRRKYIDRAYHYLDKNSEYTGYDVIILSFKTEDEAQKQKKILDLLFEGIRTKNGDPVKIITVVEKGWGKEKKNEKYKESGAGNFLATQAAYLEACKVMPELDKLWKDNAVKIMMIHNAGDSVRDGPHAISYDNSRSSQHMIGEIRTGDSVIPITPLIFTILTNMIFAESNDGRSLDLFWASEMLIPARDPAKFLSVGNNLFGVMGIDLKPERRFTLDELSKIGFYYRLKKNGRIGYIAPNVYSKELEAFEEFLSRCDMITQDAGGQRFSRAYIQEATNKFQSVLGSQSLKVEIAYHIMEPMFVIMEGMEKYSGTIDVNTCRVQDIEDILDQIIDANGTTYLTKLKNIKDIRNKGSIPDKSGVFEDNVFYKEVIDFYIALLRRVEGDVRKITRLDCLGCQDDVYWWSYRSPWEKLNADLEMITDLASKKITVNQEGNSYYEVPTLLEKIKAEDHRRLRGIKLPVENVVVKGKTYSFTADEVRQGVNVEGVNIKGSILRNCVLLPGSEIIDSVLEDVQGQVVARDSVIIGTMSPIIRAECSNIVNVVTLQNVIFHKEAAGGIFRPGIKDPVSGMEGETIFRVPIAFRGRETDDKVLAGNIDSARNLRDMECDIQNNQRLRLRARAAVSELIDRKEKEIAPEDVSGDYQDVVDGYDSYYAGAADPVNALNIKTSRDAVLRASDNVIKAGSTAVILDAGRLFDIPLKELLSQEVSTPDNRRVKKFQIIYLLDFNPVATQETVDLLGLTKEQLSRIAIIKKDESMIFSGLTNIIETYISAHSSVSPDQALEGLRTKINDFIGDPGNWSCLPFPDESIDFVVSSGGLASICQGFFRYLNGAMDEIEGWDITDENVVKLKKKLLFLIQAMTSNFAGEINRISNGTVYLSSSIDTKPEDMSVLGVTDLKDLFDDGWNLSFVNEDMWHTKITFAGERLNSIQMLTMEKKSVENYAKKFEAKRPILDIEGNIREVNISGSNRKVILLPILNRPGWENKAVAISLTWVREYYYTCHRGGSLGGWEKRYPDIEGVRTHEDLACLEIWPIVDIDEPDPEVLKWIANGGPRGPPEYANSKKIALSQFREKLKFPVDKVTSFMKYPEILALIDGVDFYFPQVFFYRDISAISDGSSVEKDPDWFRTFDGLPVKWKGVNCSLCGEDNLSPIQIIGPSRLVRCEKCGFVEDDPQAIVPVEALDKYSSSLRDARGESYEAIKRAKQQTEVFISGLRQVRPELTGAPLLEIGSASGEFLYTLREQYGWSNDSLTGVDASLMGSRFARDKYGINVVDSDLAHSGLNGKNFKIIVINSSIEHLQEVKSLFRMVNGLLDDDGIVFVGAVPNNDSLTGQLHPQGDVAKNFPDGQHLYQFTPQTIVDLGRRTGFETIRVNGQTRTSVLESVREQFFEIIYYCGLYSGEKNSDRILLDRLKEKIFELKRNIIQDKGPKYIFTCSESDFQNIESAVAFWNREIKSSPYLADDFDVWFRKESIDIEEILPQARKFLSPGILATDTLLGKDISMPVEAFLQGNVSAVVTSSDSVAKRDPNTEGMGQLIEREILRMMPDHSVAIDVGCGSGVHSLKIADIARKNNLDWKVIALDRNSRAVEQVERAAREEGTDKYIEGVESDLYHDILYGNSQKTFRAATLSRDVNFIFSNPPQMPAYRHDLDSSPFEKEWIYSEAEIWENFDYLLGDEAKYTDGLGIISRIIGEGGKILNDGGYLAIVAFAFLGEDNIRRIYEENRFDVNVIKLQKVPVRRGGITWNHMELIERLSGYTFYKEDGTVFRSVAEAHAYRGQVYQDVCLFVGHKISEPVDPESMGKAKKKEVPIGKTLATLNRAEKYLEKTPVDMIVDLSLITEKQLEGYMRTWAYIMQLHVNCGLNINYYFKTDKAKLKSDPVEILKRIITETSILNKNILEPRILREDRETGNLQVWITSVDKIRKIRAFTENVIPVAIDVSEVNPLEQPGNILTASSIGVTVAACKNIYKQRKENPLGITTGQLFSEVIDEMYHPLRAIFDQVFPDEIVTREIFMKMVSGNFVVRKNLAHSLALPAGYPEEPGRLCEYLANVGAGDSKKDVDGIYNERVSIAKVQGDNNDKPGYENIKASLRKVLQLQGGTSQIINPGDKILIKPNVGSTDLEGSYDGYITSPILVKAMIDILLESGVNPEQIIIGEGSICGEETMTNFENAGYLDMGVRLVDLNTARTREVEIPGAKVRSSMLLPIKLLESDIIINMPVLKTHRYATISCAMKNMMGIISQEQKESFHLNFLNQSIVDLNLALMCKRQLVIVDAIIAQEGTGPFEGTPKPMNLILAGFNPACVDHIAAEVAGVNPEQVKIISLAGESGMANYEDIDVVGMEVEDVREAFETPATYRELCDMSDCRIVDEHACSACVASLTRLIRKNEQIVENVIKVLRKNGEEEINFVLGADEKVPEKGFNIVLGHCQDENRRDGVYIPGCPLIGGYLKVFAEYLDQFYQAGLNRKQIYSFFNASLRFMRDKKKVYQREKYLDRVLGYILNTNTDTTFADLDARGIDMIEFFAEMPVDVVNNLRKYFAREYLNTIQDIPKLDKKVRTIFDSKTIEDMDETFGKKTFDENGEYIFKYDISRLSDEQVAVIKAYISMGRNHLSAHGSIEERPFSRDQGSDESLLAVYYEGRSGSGEGHIDVNIPKGYLKEYLLKMINMLNITFALAQIPDIATEEELGTEYSSIIGFIGAQYSEIMGCDESDHDFLKKVLSKTRLLILSLPSVYKLSPEKIRIYNKFVQKMLISA